MQDIPTRVLSSALQDALNELLVVDPKKGDLSDIPATCVPPTARRKPASTKLAL